MIEGSEDGDGDVGVEGGGKFWSFTVAGDQGGDRNQEKS